MATWAIMGIMEAYGLDVQIPQSMGLLLKLVFYSWKLHIRAPNVISHVPGGGVMLCECWEAM